MNRLDIEAVRAGADLVGLIGGDVRPSPRQGEYVGLCPFHEEKTPSFTVVAAKGFYHCFGCGAHGSAIDYLMARDQIDFRAALAALSAPALSRAGGARQKGAAPPPAPRRQEDFAAQERRVEIARRWWRESAPAANSPVECYLRQARHIRVPPPPSIRFHGRLPHPYDGRDWPVMLAAIQPPGPPGIAPVAVHRTFLARDAAGKAPVTPAKMVLGPKAGGAIRLTAAAPRMALGEGIETCLSVLQACPGLACWCAADLNNLARVVLPDTVREVILLADGDGRDALAGERALDRAARAHHRAGRVVRIARPVPGLDFNDMLAEGEGVK